MTTLRRLFSVEPLTEPGARVRLDLQESHHGGCVLWLKKGDQVAVFDDSGAQFVATLVGSEKKQLIVTLNEPLAPAPETSIPIALYLALARGNAFENVLSRAVELGVAEVVPFAAERSVPRFGEGPELGRKLEHWRKILLSATKQCGRARLTAITKPSSFQDAVKRPGERAVRFCCAFDPALRKTSEMLSSLNISRARSLAVMIGPEGGFTADEIAAARGADWYAVSLGPRILRVETAATAALALVLAALREM